MKNKKIIAIPALLALLGGAAFVANNQMNTSANDNTSADLKVTDDVTFSFASTTGASLNWFETADIRVNISMTIAGATKKVLESGLLGLEKYVVEIDQATNQTILFDIDNCNENTLAQSTTCTTGDVNLTNLYGSNINDLVDLMNAANSKGKWAKSGFLAGTVNYTVNGITVFDNAGETKSTTFDKNNEFNLNIAAGQVTFAI